MIPRSLQISGFLSYQQTTSLDFDGFDLACISGANGAGKSSLLDAITWVLFGQARRRDDTIINSLADSAEVLFDFTYENNQFRIQRSKAKNKPTLLEFYILDENDRWRTLTEHTLRETETRIQQTLRMDYETFINASFFLQGRADQFAQQRPGDRKRILSSVLGLEVWEAYRERTAEQRKALELDKSGLESLSAEIQDELKEEENRRQRLAELEKKLAQATELASAQEEMLERFRQLEASLMHQRDLLKLLADQAQNAHQRRDQLHADLTARTAERDRFKAELTSAGQVEQEYKRWQELRSELEVLDQTAIHFHQFEVRRAAAQLEIDRERIRLEGDLRQLREEATRQEAIENQIPQVQSELAAAGLELEALKAQAQQRVLLEEELRQVQKAASDARAENGALKTAMDELKEHIFQLKEISGAECPTCGQPLSEGDREQLIHRLTAQGQEMGDRYRANQAQMRAGEKRQEEIDLALRQIKQVEEQIHQKQRLHDQLTDRLQQLTQNREAWQTGAAQRLPGLEATLGLEQYAPDAREQLNAINAELRALGYDPTAHEALRQAEVTARSSQEAMRELDTARAGLQPLEREIEALEVQAQTARQEVERSEANYSQALTRYQADAANAPDIRQAEESRRRLKEQENLLRNEVGAARQRVEVLSQQKQRLHELNKRRNELAKLIARHRSLEKAFGKDGVPALLIEQALPEIETQANEILDRLSAGAMSISFSTQRDYRDKSREDKRETLDILISDATGKPREYELFSGGEAFRVNFAIRLALSRVLAQRAGARLQTLVIDEGFGSQDADGRQRLVEAINLVRNDFKKILVITHLEELKDAFPARIEVEKLPGGSSLRVIA